MKTRILTLTLIAIFFLSFGAMAQKTENRKRLPQQRQMMADRTDKAREQFKDFFTEEQQEQMKELRLETAKKMQPLRNELNELEARQQTLSTAESADMKAIEKNIDQMAKIKADMQKIRARQHQEIRSMLSDEQRIKFDNMKGRKDRKGDFERKPMQGDRFKHGA
ncbi:periplasmic heavy metal sensor [uncultured Draconibacterium sp.]|uniref:Spy/CpxP family protein refolding chaperone n=1 Tax=uncultured Draconibacterium sp. TaxID=1573823 RepID=UPI00326192A4